MQFQIPQFIEAEDKIVGPFSLRQFAWVGGGVGISMLLYFMLNFIIWLPFGAIFTIGGIAMGMVRINGRPLSATVFSAVQFFWKPHIYVWQPEHPAIPKTAAEPKTKAGGESAFSLERIAAGLALSSARDRIQTGTVESKTKSKAFFDRAKERYQIFGKSTGERVAAKRIDYR